MPRHWGVYKATHLPDSETQLFPTRRRVASRHLWDYVSPEPCWWPDSWNLSRRAPPTERESSGRGLAAKTLPPALPSWFGKADLQTAVPADLRSRQWSLLRRCGAAPGQHPVNSLLSFPLPETPGQTLSAKNFLRILAIPQEVCNKPPRAEPASTPYSKGCLTTHPPTV